MDHDLDLTPDGGAEFDISVAELNDPICPKCHWFFRVRKLIQRPARARQIHSSR